MLALSGYLARNYSGQCTGKMAFTVMHLQWGRSMRFIVSTSEKEGYLYFILIGNKWA